MNPVSPMLDLYKRGVVCVALFATVALWAEVPVRETLVKALLSDDLAEQTAFITEVAGSPDPAVSEVLSAWRQGGVFIVERPGSVRLPVVLDPRPAGENGVAVIEVGTGKTLLENGKQVLFATADLTAADTTSKLRKIIKAALDLRAITDPNPLIRRDGATRLAFEQNADYLPHFRERLKVEKVSSVSRALREAIAVTELASEDLAVRRAAVTTLGDLRSIASLDLLKKLQQSKTIDSATRTATERTLAVIESYLFWGNFAGTFFRGVSLSAVLLVVALGLAITFGLMGVINMAHGEVMMIGAYTAYAVQNVMSTGLSLNVLGKAVTIPGMRLTGAALDSYFLIALPASFIVGALVGLILERGVIRFLYKRPLESLLATWGVSLVLQQFIRGTFGPANVQVNAPQWLSGSINYNDVLFAYNRLFVIGFAAFVVLLAYLLLNKTSLGLQIRAVMQNRTMASCMGVRTERINMLTFAFGSGLAGMAGACLSQIANVGPSLGQSYIVDCFMIVTLGGVGNLVGTVTASAGIGITDQLLQPWLGAVLGKIAVLGGIILFLQWRPAGIFVTRSRSLDS